MQFFNDITSSFFILNSTLSFMNPYESHSVICHNPESVHSESATDKMSVDSESDAEIDVVGDRDPFDEVIDVNEDPSMDTNEQESHEKSSNENQVIVNL